MNEFEGHSPGPWDLTYWDLDGTWSINGEGRYGDHVASIVINNEANARLMAAAPDLLAEVKRLRDLVDFAIAAIDSNDCYMGEEAQADLLNYLRGEEE